MFDVRAEQWAVTDDYRNVVLRQVGASCLRLAVFRGAYRWPHHAHAGELFLVVGASSCRRARCTAHAPS